MWQLVNHYLHNKTIYKKNQVEYDGIRFRIRAIYSKPRAVGQIGDEKLEQEMNSGFVLKKETRFSFFSKSCQIYILIEIS